MYSVVHAWIVGLPFWAGALVWVFGNLSLALIPVPLARFLKAGVDGDMATVGRPRWWVRGPVAFLWLLFLPNTAYLMTEWRHYLLEVASNPAYYPVLHGVRYPADVTRNLVLLTGFFGVYTLCGLAAFVYAMEPIDAMLTRYTRNAGRWMVPILFLLCSVGVYLGLVDRLNSWDPLNARTFAVIASAPARIATSPWLAILIVCFAAFLWLVYRFTSRRVRFCGTSAVSPLG
jgi:uncharacterized membrane protein